MLEPSSKAERQLRSILLELVCGELEYQERRSIAKNYSHSVSVAKFRRSMTRYLEQSKVSPKFFTGIYLSSRPSTHEPLASK